MFCLTRFFSSAERPLFFVDLTTCTPTATKVYFNKN
jgi:hypothetical protein